MATSSANSKDRALPALLEAQRAFFKAGKTLPIADRLDYLGRFGESVQSHTDDFLDALASDLGKPPLEAYLSEVHFLISELRLFQKKLKQWSRPRRVGNPFYFLPARSEIRREPFGTALIASAWNYPLQLALSPAVAAIAAGNVVVLKPSELAPTTAQLMADLVESVFDPAHFTVIQGGPEVGQALLDQPFDAWFYTGSSRVGKLYAEAAARSLAPVTLELGGKCPCLLDSNVDLDAAVSRIIQGKFFNAGQTCIAPDFVLVPEALHDSFVEKATELLRTFYPKSPSEDLARIVNSSHYDRLSALINDNAIRIGEDDSEKRYLAPTLIPRATWDLPCMTEEIFGPILPVIPYSNLEETFSSFAQQPSPLALYAFSRDRDFLEKVATTIPSGSICFNDVLKQATNLNLPFGGVHESGMGRYRGKAGFETFTYERAVTKRYFARDPFEMLPPYTGALERMRKLLK